jgi:hypothetical protein
LNGARVCTIIEFALMTHWFARLERRILARGSDVVTRNLKTMQKITTLAHVTVFVAALVAFAGCGKGGCAVSSSSSTAVDINGSKSSRKTITRTHDGVTRRLETTTDVDLENGKVTKFPKAALIKIEEEGGPEQRHAELRENAGKLELWIKDKGSFRRGSAEDEKWLEGFLGDITTK